MAAKSVACYKLPRSQVPQNTPLYELSGLNSCNPASQASRLDPLGEVLLRSTRQLLTKDSGTGSSKTSRLASTHTKLPHKGTINRLYETQGNKLNTWNFSANEQSSSIQLATFFLHFESGRFTGNPLKEPSTVHL